MIQSLMTGRFLQLAVLHGIYYQFIFEKFLYWCGGRNFRSAF